MRTKSKPEPGDLRERALRYLARREHSRAELARKLELAGFAADETRQLLDEFEEKNWLSDRRFAESYVADHRARSGNIKLGYELRQRGVSGSVIDDVLLNNRESETARARAVWSKKFGEMPANALDVAKQMSFLQRRGFATETIREILSLLQ